MKAVKRRGGEGCRARPGVPSSGETMAVLLQPLVITLTLAAVGLCGGDGCGGHRAGGGGCVHVARLRMKTDDAQQRDLSALLAGLVFDGQMPQGWDGLEAGESMGESDPPCSADHILHPNHRDHDRCQAAPDEFSGLCWRCFEDPAAMTISHVYQTQIIRIEFGAREDGRKGIAPFRLGPELGNLSHLEVLQLDYTGLMGTLPPQLGALLNLKRLVLSRTDISGTLPPELGNLTRLEQLQISFTSITGVIPRQFERLSELQRLWLQGSTLLSGTLPPQLRQLHVLDTMWLDQSQLSGTIPPGIAGPDSKLVSVSLSESKISGTLPATLCAAPVLKELTCRNCKLDGSGIADQRSLSWSDWQVDGLSWSPALAVLDLGTNEMTELPATLPVNLTHLYLNNNPINATAPALAAMLKPMERLSAFDVTLVNAVDLRHTRVNLTKCSKQSTCEIILYLFDSQNQPVPNPGRLSAMRNATVRAGCDIDQNRATFIPLREGGQLDGDNSGHPIDGSSNCTKRRELQQVDGHMHASIPVSWAPDQIPGNLTVSFFDSDDNEFFPQKDADGTLVLESHEASQAERLMSELRTVRWKEVECRQPATLNQQGTRCECTDPLVQAQHTSGEFRCECNHSAYNYTAVGQIRCVSGGWTEEEATAALKDQEVSDCLRCPTCAVCGVNQTVQLQSGWRPDEKTLETLKYTNESRLPVIYVYRCRDGTAGCPPIHLSNLRNVRNGSQNHGIECLNNANGTLCGSCKAGFTWHHDGQSLECTLCKKYQFPRLLAAVFVVLLVALLLGPCLYRLRALRYKFKANLKILLGLAQVLALLSDVLDLLFPPQPREVMSTFGLLTANLQQLVIRLECHSAMSWLERWMVSVGAVPIVAALTIGGRWLWQHLRARRLHDTEEAQEMEQVEAQRSAVSTGFFVTMLIYPKISTEILKIFPCRQLGPTDKILEADYGTDCSDNSSTYGNYRAFAFALVLLVPIGVPALLLSLLLLHGRRHMQRYERATRGTDNEHADGANSSGADDGSHAVQRQSMLSAADGPKYRHTKLRGTFDFCVQDFRPECYWFEPVDLLRKLALTGLLQFFNRGTAVQVLFGCCLAIASLVLQLVLKPYKDPEANWLKAVVDIQLMITFLISFILRVLPLSDSNREVEMYEPFKTEAEATKVYGWLLIGSLIAVIFFAMAMMLRQYVQNVEVRGKAEHFLPHMQEMENMLDHAGRYSQLPPPDEPPASLGRSSTVARLLSNFAPRPPAPPTTVELRMMAHTNEPSPEEPSAEQPFPHADPSERPRLETMSSKNAFQAAV